LAPERPLKKFREVGWRARHVTKTRFNISFGSNWGTRTVATSECGGPGREVTSRRDDRESSDVSRGASVNLKTIRLFGAHRGGDTKGAVRRPSVCFGWERVECLRDDRVVVD
jgi:hypothetical protein